MASKAEINKALIEAFKAFDKDGSGSINASELKEVLTEFYKAAKKPVNDAEISSVAAEFLTQSDTNKDGKINQQEFVKFFEDILS